MIHGQSQARRLQFRLKACDLFTGNGNQFNIKLQSCVGWNHTPSATGAIGNGGRARELGFATNFHQLNAFSPARNDGREWKVDGLIALVGVVKFFAIRQSATIVHRHFV